MRRALVCCMWLILLSAGCGRTVSGSTAAEVCELARIQFPEASAVTSSTTFKDLGADELDVVEFIMTVEEHFGVRLPDEAIGQAVGDRNWKLEQWADSLGQVSMGQLAELVQSQQLGKR